MTDDLVQRVYRAFGPEPLRSDQTDLYVNLDEARGSDDIGSRLAKKIQLAEQPTCQVLAGHNGSGKSTELNRLKRTLENGERPFFVVLCKADEDIDRNDIDFPEVLIAMVRQLAAQIKQPPAAITLKPGYFKDRWERIRKLMTTEIEFSEFELDVALGKLGGTLKGSPDARLEIRKLLEPDTSNWILAANDVMDEAVLKLRKKGYAGLVVLVDDLDKMVVRADSDGSRKDENLFVNRSAQLTAFRCHVVYTMPLSLAYSSHAQTIAARYGGDVPVVPMTKLATRPPKPRPFKDGIAKFREVVEARVRSAGATMSQIFDGDGIVEELIKLTGGQPTELMGLTREAIVTHGLPIDGRSLERVRKDGQRIYDRQLRDDHWPILDQVRRTGDFSRKRQDEGAFRELLDGRAVLQYRNDEEWYDLNPMVASLRRPGRAGSKR